MAGRSDFGVGLVLFFTRAGMRSLNSPEFRKRLNSGEFSYDKRLIPARAK